MDSEEWIVQLGRLYKEVSTTEAPQGANAYVDQFNRILTKLQEEFPDNEFIQNTEPANRSARLGHKADAIKEVKMKCGQLADVLGYDLPEGELEQAGDITVISLKSDQHQATEQSVTQEVSVETIMEMISYTTLNQSKQEELRDIVKQFEDELSSDQPDSARLRNFIESAKTYSVDVSAKLAMLALSNGIVDVLGF